MGALLNIRCRRVTAVVSALVLLLLLGLVYNHKTSEQPFTEKSMIPQVRLPSYLGGGKKSDVVSGSKVEGTPEGASGAAMVHAAASNSTLGFSKIVAIHMKHRWDKWDAAMIQAYTSGLDIEYFEGVDGVKDIRDRNRTGLPPDFGRPQRDAATACYRSHANVWAEMVRTRSPPVLILESDAAWDVNIRGIMGLANKNLIEWLHESGSRAADAPPNVAEAQDGPKHRPVEWNPDDPWQSEHWDVLGFGHCNEEIASWKPEEFPAQHQYDDPFAAPPDGLFSSGTRKVYRSMGWACLTGYAVSHRGAAKMVTQMAMALAEPVDMVITHMIDAGDLISMVVQPPPFVQWDYRKNIGMDDGASSDLARIDWAPEVEDAKAKMDDSGWPQAIKDKSVWAIADKCGWVKLKKSALFDAWKTIFSAESQFTMPEIPGLGDVLSLPQRLQPQPTEQAENTTEANPAGTRR